MKRRHAMKWVAAMALGLVGFAVAGQKEQPAIVDEAAVDASSTRADARPALAVDGDLQARWVAAERTASGRFTVELAEPARIGAVVVREGLDRRIEWFAVQVDAGEGWRTVEWSGWIGRRRRVALDPVRAERVRLLICEASGPPAIEEIAVYRTDRKE